MFDDDDLTKRERRGDHADAEEEEESPPEESSLLLTSSMLFVKERRRGCIIPNRRFDDSMDPRDDAKKCEYAMDKRFLDGLRGYLRERGREREVVFPLLGKTSSILEESYGNWIEGSISYICGF